MRAHWDIAGQGEWHDNTIRLTSLSTGFDQLHYGAMTVTSPRLALNKPIVWVRDATTPSLQGALSLEAGKTVFTSGSVLPPSTINFSVEGREPTLFQFKGDLRAGGDRAGTAEWALGWRTPSRTGLVAEAVAYRFPAVASTRLENDAARRLTVCAGGFFRRTGAGI